MAKLILSSSCDRAEKALKPRSPSFLTSRYRPGASAWPLLGYGKRLGADYVGLRSKRAAQANPSRQCLKNRRTKRSLCQSRSRSQPRLGRERKLAKRAFISIYWRVHLRDRFGPRMVWNVPLAAQSSRRLTPSLAIGANLG